MFGRGLSRKIQKKKMSTPISKCVPMGFTLVEEQECWSVFDPDHEMVIEARHYDDLKDRLRTILEAKNEVVEDSLMDFIAKKKAEA